MNKVIKVFIVIVLLAMSFVLSLLIYSLFSKYIFVYDRSWCNGCSDQIFNNQTIHTCTLLLCAPRPVWAFIIDIFIFLLSFICIAYMGIRISIKNIFSKLKLIRLF